MGLFIMKVFEIAKSMAAALFIAAVLLPGPALADGRGHGNGPGEKPGRRSVPEFDPTAAGAVAALVAGGGVLLARRRRQRP